MARKILNFALIAAVVGGAVLACRTGAERNRLATIYQRLAQLTGDFPINDPSKAHFLALDAEEKRHYAWGIYLPPSHARNINFNHEVQLPPLTNGAAPTHSIVRVAINVTRAGRIMVFARYPGRRSRILSLGDEALGDFLRNRWDEIRVERLGTDGVAVVEPDQSTVLLRLTMPDSMADKARRTLDSSIVERHVPVLLELKLDPEPPAPKP